MKKICFVMIGCILLIGLSADAQNYQYKRIGLNAVADLLDGKTDAVIERLNKILNDLPGDAETQYCLALAHAQKGDMETAMGYVEKSIENGLDFGRYLAGPKSLLRPLEKVR
ncbi:hypothetical protein GF373_11935, partial [bacterium]|nr:hypothetical protein [bacterium]